MHPYIHSTIHNSQDGNNWNGHQQMNRWRRCGRCIRQSITQPSAATWIQLEILILSEVRKKNTDTIWYHLYVESKKGHKSTYLRNKKTQREQTCGCQRGGGVGEDELGFTDVNYWFRMDKGQGPTVQHRELYTVSCSNLSWKRIWKAMHVYMYNWITLLYIRN